MGICNRNSHTIHFYVCHNLFTLGDVGIQKYSTKCKRAEDNRQPEQQMALSEGTSVTVCELHGVFTKIEACPRTSKRSYEQINYIIN